MLFSRMAAPFYIPTFFHLYVPCGPSADWVVPHHTGGGLASAEPNAKLFSYYPLRIPSPSAVTSAGCGSSPGGVTRPSSLKGPGHDQSCLDRGCSFPLTESQGLLRCPTEVPYRMPRLPDALLLTSTTELQPQSPLGVRISRPSTSFPRPLTQGHEECEVAGRQP